MMDPRRLLESSADEVELALLRAGASEEPPADGPLRLAAALGLPVAGSGAGSAPPPAAGLETVASKALLKWLALAGSGAAVIAAVAVYRGDSEPAAPRPGTGVPSAAPAPAAPAQAPPAPTTEQAAQDPSGVPVAGEPRTLQASKSIAAEIERLERVRARLQRGDARAALAALDAYRSAHPAGVLRQEASVLRIEALVRAGDEPAARRAATAFLRDNPKSPHAARIRALLRDQLDAR